MFPQGNSQSSLDFVVKVKSTSIRLSSDDLIQLSKMGIKLLVSIEVYTL